MEAIQEQSLPEDVQAVKATTGKEEVEPEDPAQADDQVCTAESGKLWAEEIN